MIININYRPLVSWVKGFITFAVLGFLVSCAHSSKQLASAPTQLRVELLKGPHVVQINDVSPEFSWQLPSTQAYAEQQAYQIQVISAAQSFAQLPLTSLVWDSGKIADRASVARSFSAPNLQPGYSYQWRVRVWTKPEDEAGATQFASAWSQPQRFTVSNQHSAYTSRYPIETKTVDPVFIKQLPSGRYLIDFGKVAFGYLALSLTSEQAGTIQVNFAERGHAQGPEQGVISKLNKKSSVRYYEVGLKVNAKSDVYAVHPPQNMRNTKAGKAIAIPPMFGRIAPFRFIEIDPKGLTLSDISASQIMLHYPFDEFQSSFTSSNETLNAIWELCKYSIKATSFAGIYVDGDRERIPYEADAYINQLSHYYVDDEFSLARYSHEYLMQHPTWPTEWKQHSVMMAWTDWMYTGDTESLQLVYQQLKEEKLLEHTLNHLGLLSTYPKRNMAIQMGDIVDWPPIERDNYDFRPVNTVVNAFYYLNLKQMADISLALGLKADAEKYLKQANTVYTAFNKHLFDETSGLYLDGLGSNHSAVHANIMPLVAGLVPKQNQQRILEYIKQKGMAVSVYFSQYLLDALYQYGEADYALSLLTAKHKRSWYNMIRQGSTITMEAWDDEFKPNQDWNHAWGAVPGNIIGRYILGVEPVSAGLNKVKIAPQPASLSYVSGKVPTIRGPISVEIKQPNDRTMKLQLSIPGNTKAEVVLPNKKNMLPKHLTVNGKPVAFSFLETGIQLPNLFSGYYKIEVVYTVKNKVVL